MANALAFVCSAAVLILEILAGRLLAPYVGVSLETYTGVIGTVLAGIAIGSAVGGRLADRFDARRLLGPVVLAGGLLSLLTLPTVSALGPVLVRGDRRVAIVLLALTAFVLPTAVLSAVGPMVAKLRLTSTDETGAVVGTVSAAGTAGALVGTFLTGFVLVAAWPSRPIIVAVGLVLVAVGVALSVRLGAFARHANVVVLLPAIAFSTGAAVTAPTPCELETAYFCATVVPDPTRPSGRTLVLDDLRHSYVDLEDPRHLEFRYERLFAHAVDALVADRAPAVLHIGGGGFTFPRWMLATRPDSRHRVLELDRDVFELAQRRLGLRTSRRLQVAVGDARITLRDEPTGAYDVAVGDAFGGRSVPWHLTTVEVLGEVKRTLRPSGVYVLNIIDGGDARFVRAEMATLAHVWEHVAVVVPPSGTFGNYVVVASDRPIAMRPPPPALGRLLGQRDAVARFVGDAEVLTDDHAPVDQLIAPRPNGAGAERYR